MHSLYTRDNIWFLQRYKATAQSLFAQKLILFSIDDDTKNDLLHTEHYNMPSDCNGVYQASHN